MVQAKQLAPVYEKYDHFYFTFSCEVAKDLVKTSRLRTIPNIVRYNPISWIIGAVLSGYIAVCNLVGCCFSDGFQSTIVNQQSSIL